MNRITYSLVLCILLCSTFFSGCLSEQNENKTVTTLTEIDDYSITNISVWNGFNGDFTTINDKETIDQLIEVLDTHTLEEIGLESVSGGICYSLTFFHDSTEISNLTIVQEDLLYINGIYYKVNNTHINMIELKKLIYPVDFSNQQTYLENNDGISSYLNIDAYEITKVSIINGFTRESGTTDNVTTIVKLISDLDRYQLEEAKEPFSNGYRYFLYFYNESGSVSRASVVDNNSVLIGNVLYEVIGPSIDMTKLEEFIISSSNSTSASNDKGLNVGVSSSMEYLSIENMTSQSDIIISGTITGVYPSRWNTPDGKRPDKPDSELNIGTEDMIYTDFGIHVNRYVKTALDTQELQITVEGGTAGADSIWVEDAPSFEYGENVMLFLNWNNRHASEFTVVGGFQGKFTMIDAETAARDDGVSVTITEEYGHWAINEI